MESTRAIKWLLEDDQPSIRYLTLTELLGKGEKDGDVRSARRAISERGWAKEIFERQAPGGWWVSEESLYQPKYISTNWMLLILSDLGVSKEDPRIERPCELWVKRFAKRDGGFDTEGAKRGHLCIVGNTARALVKFGYVNHPKVRKAFEWLVKNQSKLGGWSCYLSGRNLDSWEPLSAFAVYPRQKWTRGMKRAVERGCGILS